MRNFENRIATMYTVFALEETRPPSRDPGGSFRRKFALPPNIRVSALCSNGWRTGIPSGISIKVDVANCAHRQIGTY